MNKCPRGECSSWATHRVRVTFLSGRRLDETLCETHATRLHVGLLCRPQTLSGSCTPVAVGLEAA